MHIKLCIAFSWNKILHALPVKRIFCYLKGTKDKGIILKTDKSNKIDCRVDAASLSVPSQELHMLSSTVTYTSFGCHKCKLKLHCKIWKQSIMLSPNL
jgi:hypothetical protein